MEFGSDWLTIRVRVALIGLRLGLVIFISYTVCANRFLE